jgi:2'-5' RNA ligase
VTLRFLGPVEEEVVPDLVAALTVATRTAPVPTAQIGPATVWFGTGRVLVVPVAGLDDLAAAVRRGTAGIPGPPGTGPPFNGHLTVARPGRRPLRPAARARVAGLPFRSEFEVDAVDLVASVSSAHGPHYLSLGRASVGPGHPDRPPVA